MRPDAPLAPLNLGNMKTILCVISLFTVIHLSAQQTPSDNGKSALILVKVTGEGDNIQLSVGSVTIIPGLVKAPLMPSAGNVLVFQVTDARQEVLESVTQPHPLQTRYESPGQDGKIESTVVTVKEKQLVLRVPYHASMKYLSVIRQASDAQKLRPLAVVELKVPKE